MLRDHMAKPRPAPDLARIQRLRELFLDDRRVSGALPDYWRDRKDLLAYDAVLGARIGWKWDAALDECAERGFARADGDVVFDYGCGAGIAARRFVARFGGKQVLLHDRSAHARNFAVERLAAEAPDVPARATTNVQDAAPDVLLVSHVLGELDDDGERELRALIDRSRRVVIVEPGNRATSRRLSELRDALLVRTADDEERRRLRCVAPCPHAGACPSLFDKKDWCHFFATPPPEVFTDGWWVKTALELEIDVRSLPYAFLALARGPRSADEANAAPPERALGRAELTPHVAKLRVCRDGELSALEITKRREANLWRALKKRPEQARQLLADREPPTS